MTGYWGRACHGWRWGEFRTITSGLALVAALTLCVGALAPAVADGSTPVALSAAGNGDSPLVAYDPVSGYTFVAWADPQGSSGGIELCILAGGQPGAKAGSNWSVLPHTDRPVTTSTTSTLTASPLFKGRATPQTNISRILHSKQTLSK